MEIPNELECLFAGKVTNEAGTYTIEVPEQEVEIGEVATVTTYRVALLPQPEVSVFGDTDSTTDSESEPSEAFSTPLVAEGDHRTVDIDGVGDEGDGLTRVERGFVVIVPDTEPGDRVRIKITDVQQRVAFAEVVERVDFYE